MAKNTISNWELNRNEPEVQCYPKIIDFLGYVPFSMGESFPARLKAYRMVKGLTQQELARELGVDRSTMQLWEAGTQRPRRETQERVLGVIEQTY